MPLYACVPESATWITYFRFLSIAASPPTAIIGAVCLKSAIGFRISVFCLGTVIRSNRFRYFCIYFLKTLLRIRSVSQLIAPLGRRGISAPVLQGKKSWLGKNALTSDLSDSQIEENILDSLAQLNCAVGINNHMGSKIMEDERILNILFKIAGEKNLIFVDSKTTPKTKAKLFAQKYNVKLYGRDMFIDNKDKSKVRENLIKTIKIASNKGFAIAIGHVGPAGGKITAQAIKEIYDEYKDKGVKFVTLTQINKYIQ